jgi:hypothetical protein
MRMCQEHWDALVQGVKDRGMWHLVAQSDVELAEKLMNAFEDGADLAKVYDPLMAANGAIASAAIHEGGLYLLEGDFCPLCEVKKHGHGPGMDKDWIEGSLDDQLQYALDRGLLVKQ